MKPSHTLLAAVALTAASGLIAYQRAEACSPPLPCPEMRYPLDGATDVPTNTKLWTRNYGTLLLDDGVADPIELTLAELVTPPDELAPNTTYTVTLLPDPEQGFGCEEAVSLSFTTGDGPDAKPAAPAINEITATFQPADEANTCGPTVDLFFIELSLNPPLVADAVAHRVYQLEAGARVGGGANHMVPAQPWFYANGVVVDEDYEVVAVSASGLESDASTFEVVEAAGPEHRHGDGGCQAGGAAAGPGGAAWLALIGLLALGLRRAG